MADEPKSGTSGSSKYYRKAIEEDKRRSSTGFLLLAIGLFLAWIPYVQYLGDLLLFIGILMIFFGRNGFSDNHVLNVDIAIFLIITMIMIAIMIVVISASTIASLNLSNNSGTITSSQALHQLSAIFSTYLGAMIVVSLIVGISYVLIPYDLLEKSWRILLIIAFLIMVGISITSYVLVSGLISNIISNAGTSSFLTIAANVLGQATLNGLLAAIPDILLGIIYLHARTRIEWGETKE